MNGPSASINLHSGRVFGTHVLETMRRASALMICKLLAGLRPAFLLVSRPGFVFHRADVPCELSASFLYILSNPSDPGYKISEW